MEATTTTLELRHERRGVRPPGGAVLGLVGGADGRGNWLLGLPPPGLSSPEHVGEELLLMSLPPPLSSEPQLVPPTVLFSKKRRKLEEPSTVGQA
eukprot:CAMPEP_0177494994 /NCGR_PEP_ID=MMETSP0369-20130122/33738_1 /TAXON_ID=447022 ORGANISM="Scrippsiella hangoei-like, Strain SHHI-4" /NCGR_SAMPLE_ID=MMETSP0369 /ASSEMBLY_ACC=CAM_ASM_000364 /LENGTH=94 /DNA_ID=CAMNT_0018971971 /DNA_START=118 /DNA_END=399 /DNA_ORIENTATION=-